ncbi:MAG TPA: hypothetical protein EYM95_17460 [Candidatus Obscuribacterales bacterium]|nr:hypothetical protein [Candidatus Obscuribacterales bacterium]
MFFQKLRLLVPALFLGLFGLGALAQDEELFAPVEKMVNPKFKDEKERQEYMMKVAERVRSAAQRYASHHKGILPKQVDNAFMSYMIFGECDDKTFTSWSIPINPYLGKHKPILTGNISDPEKCRKSPPGKMEPGSVEYSIAASGKDFTVRVGAGNRKAMLDPKNKKQTYVLSNDSDSQVKANMRTVQWAAELYKEDHFKFPKVVDDEFKYYFPWGDPKKKKLGNALPNPYSGKLEYPVFNAMSCAYKERRKAPITIPPGRVEYSSTDDQSNYCIRAGDRAGKAIAGVHGSKSTLVLAKDGDGSGHGNDAR